MKPSSVKSKGTARNMPTVEDIITLRQNNPCMTLREIGSSVGVSREWARQVLAEKGMPTKALRVYTMYRCLNCGQEFRKIDDRRTNKFCTKKCWQEYLRVPASCSECGKIFYVLQSDLLNRLQKRKDERLYCSKRCHGKVLGREHGIGMPGHPLSLTVIENPELLKKGTMTNATCLCGKPMVKFFSNKHYLWWHCEPEGCGRLLLEDRSGKQRGTWYLAEMNEGDDDARL